MRSPPPVVLAVMLAFAVSAPVASTAVSGPTINIDNFTFGPMEITVPAGATVTWINGDDVPHTVRAVDGSFHSKPLDTGDRYSVTFTGPGEYDYYCSIHPRMTAKVIVK